MISIQSDLHLQSFCYGMAASLFITLTVFFIRREIKNLSK